MPRLLLIWFMGWVIPNGSVLVLGDRSHASTELPPYANAVLSSIRSGEGHPMPYYHAARRRYEIELSMMGSVGEGHMTSEIGLTEDLLMTCRTRVLPIIEGWEKLKNGENCLDEDDVGCRLSKVHAKQLMTNYLIDSKLSGIMDSCYTFPILKVRNEDEISSGLDNLVAIGQLCIGSGRVEINHSTNWKTPPSDDYKPNFVPVNHEVPSRAVVYANGEAAQYFVHQDYDENQTGQTYSVQTPAYTQVDYRCDDYHTTTISGYFIDSPIPHLRIVVVGTMFCDWRHVRPKLIKDTGEYEVRATSRITTSNRRPILPEIFDVHKTDLLTSVTLKDRDLFHQGGVPSWAIPIAPKPSSLETLLAGLEGWCAVYHMGPQLKYELCYPDTILQESKDHYTNKESVTVVAYNGDLEAPAKVTNSALERFAELDLAQKINASSPQKSTVVFPAPPTSPNGASFAPLFSTPIDDSLFPPPLESLFTSLRNPLVKPKPLGYPIRFRSLPLTFFPMPPIIPAHANSQHDTFPPEVVPETFKWGKDDGGPYSPKQLGKYGIMLRMMKGGVCRADHDKNDHYRATVLFFCPQDFYKRNWAGREFNYKGAIVAVRELEYCHLSIWVATPFACAHPDLLPPINPLVYGKTGGYLWDTMGDARCTIEQEVSLDTASSVGTDPNHRRTMPMKSKSIRPRIDDTITDTTSWRAFNVPNDVLNKAMKTRHISLTDKHAYLPALNYGLDHIGMTPKLGHVVDVIGLMNKEGVLRRGVVLAEDQYRGEPGTTLPLLELQRRVAAYDWIRPNTDSASITMMQYAQLNHVLMLLFEFTPKDGAKMTPPAFLYLPEALLRYSSAVSHSDIVLWRRSLNSMRVGSRHGTDHIMMDNVMVEDGTKPLNEERSVLQINGVELRNSVTPVGNAYFVMDVVQLK